MPERTPTAVPHERGPAEPPPVKYEELLELARRRRSVRWFLPKPVPREMIDRAIAVAALSPSACNLQPFEFRVFDDAELTQKVASIPMGTVGFRHNFPAIVVLIGKLYAWFSEPDRHLIYIDASLAAAAFLFGLEAQGLGSWPLPRRSPVLNASTSASTTWAPAPATRWPPQGGCGRASSTCTPGRPPCGRARERGPASTLSPHRWERRRSS